MEPLPKRTSLVHETARTLKLWIGSGILKEALPGELQLKERLKVGRDTLRAALRMLAEEGWILAQGQGRHRRVTLRRPEIEGVIGVEKLPVTFLSPHTIEHRVTLIEMEDARERLE